MKRRKFLKVAGILGGATVLTGIYSWQIEPFWLEFTHVKMRINNLPQELVGKTLMQISDIHLGTKSRDNYIRHSFEKAAALHPDFVAYTGDFITYETDEQLLQLQNMLPLAPRGKLGTMAILGNHDYGKNWADGQLAKKITTIVEQQNIPVLRNSHQYFNGLQVIGIDDKWGTNFKPQEAMKTWDPSAASVVLCHNPDVMDMPVWNGYNGWVLSGHTHGGQCKPPFLPPPLLPVANKKYTSGKFDFEDGRTLYINRALGFTWQVRFNVRPEITIFELQRA